MSLRNLPPPGRMVLVPSRTPGVGPRLAPAPAPAAPPEPAPIAAPLTAAADLPPADPGRLLKPEEVAARLGISERTLERWRTTGEGPVYISLSRKTVRYTAGAVDAFITAAARRNTAGR